MSAVSICGVVLNPSRDIFSCLSVLLCLWIFEFFIPVLFALDSHKSIFDFQSWMKPNMTAAKPFSALTVAEFVVALKHWRSPLSLHELPAFAAQWPSERIHKSNQMYFVRSESKSNDWTCGRWWKKYSDILLVFYKYSVTGTSPAFTILLK